MGEKSSDRRSFVRKLLGLGAAAGATSLLLSGDKSLIPLAQEGSGSGATVDIDQLNYGVGQTELRSTITTDAVLQVHATAYSGTTCGVYGQSESTSGIGVYGYAVADSGATYGVAGDSNSIGHIHSSFFF